LDGNTDVVQSFDKQFGAPSAIDPDKVTPLKSEAQSQEYLLKAASRDE
jgi:hypothetical protein